MVANRDGEPAQRSLGLLGFSDLNSKNVQVQKTVVGQGWVCVVLEGGGSLKEVLGYSSRQVCKVPLLL